jgi:hypothetical protein
MQANTNRTRHGYLLVVTSASVTIAAAVTVGALTGYLHPPRSVESTAVEAAVAAPSPRTVLVPIRPDGPTAPASLDGEVREPRLISAHSGERHARRDRDQDGERRRHEEHEHDD